jgi:hypothetical protein
VADGLDRQIESGLGDIEDALAHGVLLVDLDGLIEQLCVQVLDLFQGHVELFHQRHDLVACDVATFLTGLENVLDVHQGARVVLDLDCGRGRGRDLVHLRLPWLVAGG